MGGIEDVAFIALGGRSRGADRLFVGGNEINQAAGKLAANADHCADLFAVESDSHGRFFAVNRGDVRVDLQVVVLPVLAGCGFDDRGG